MKRILLGFVLVFAALFTNLSAEESPRAVIVFDASGSMWGQINGKTKIEIAREALKNVINEWNPNVELGLTVYGHRTKGDCNDIESVIPIGKVDKKRVVDTVMSIKPKGKTPISRSLKKAADELKYTEEKATIILISDGKETCDPDPCAAAKELEAQGIDFVTHVIGFNVDKKTDKQLECIAHATGGEYFSAKNATALNQAMKVIVKKVEKKEEPQATKLELIAKYKTLGKSGLGVSGVQWFVRQGGKSIYDNDDPLNHQPQIELASGKAHVKMVYPLATYPITVERDIILAPKPKNREVFTIDNGTVKITASETEGGKNVKGSYHIYPVIDGTASEDEITWCVSDHSTPCKRELAIGTYLIKASYNNFKREKKFDLKSSELKKIHITFEQTGKVELSASEKEGGKWIAGAYHQIYRVVDGTVEDSRIAGCSSSKKEACLKQLPVGKYIVKSTYNEFKKETPLEIKAGETVKLHIVFGEFVISAKCPDINAKISYEIYAGNGQLVYEKKMKCSDAMKVSLNDGDYSVEAKIDSGTGEAKFTVGAGKPSNLILDLTNLNHEEEIKADSAEAVVVPVKAKEMTTPEKKSDFPKNNEPHKQSNSEKITIGDKEIEIKGVSKKDAEQIKNLGAMLGALGGMMQGGNTAGSKEEKAKQDTKNAETDKEFEEMSKDLDMVIK